MAAVLHNAAVARRQWLYKNSFL